MNRFVLHFALFGSCNSTPRIVQTLWHVAWSGIPAGDNPAPEPPQWFSLSMALLAQVKSEFAFFFSSGVSSEKWGDQDAPGGPQQVAIRGTDTEKSAGEHGVSSAGHEAVSWILLRLLLMGLCFSGVVDRGEWLRGGTLHFPPREHVEPGTDRRSVDTATCKIPMHIWSINYELMLSLSVLFVFPSQMRKAQRRSDRKYVHNLGA